MHTPAFCSRHLVLVAPLVSQPTSIQLVQTKSSDRQYFTAGWSSSDSMLSSVVRFCGVVSSRVGASTAMSTGRAMSNVDFVRVRHFRAEPSTYSHRGPFVNTYCSCCTYAWWLSLRNNARRRRSSSSMCPTYFCPRRFCERHFRRCSTSHVTLGVPWQSTTSFQQRGIRAWARRKKVNARSSVLKAFSSVFLNCLSLRSSHRDRSCLCRCSLSVGFKSVPIGQFSCRAENRQWKLEVTAHLMLHSSTSFVRHLWECNFRRHL